MIPTYSEAAKAAIPIITNTSYKAFLFFEDEGSENFYTEIIKKLTPEHKNIRVICLKGKDSLITHCKDITNKSTKNKTLYVLDKDFDNILNTKIEDTAIFYLEKYSIENYLLEQNAIDRVVLEEKPKIKKITAKDQQIEEHLSQQSPLFFKLTSLFLINQVYALGIKSCSEPIQRFSIDKSPWLLCNEKIKNYEEDISSLLILNEYITTEDELIEVIATHKNKISDFCDVPGKQIIDIVRNFINHTYDIRIPSRESLAFRIASISNFDSLDNLRRKVKSIL